MLYLSFLSTIRPIIFRPTFRLEVMANIAQQRIQREFREVVKSKEIAESGVQLELVMILGSLLLMLLMMMIMYRLLTT